VVYKRDGSEDLLEEMTSSCVVMGGDSIKAIILFDFYLFSTGTSNMIANALDTLYPLSGLLKRKRVDQKDAMVLYDSRVMETTPYGIYEHICRFDELKLNGPTKEQQNEVLSRSAC
jgi:hypothetical protein